jgi:hypothetical protein
MARNVKIQVLRGVQANLPSDLALGEMYFATDTGNLFFGTPSYGSGSVQIGDTRDVNETLQAVLAELRVIRAALVTLACDGGKQQPKDFEPNQFSQVTEEEN